MSSKICIIDYKTGGNIFSVQNSLKHIGANSYISSDPSEVLKADKIFFPGVGSFYQAIESLKKLGLDQALKEKINGNIPTLSICLGMQVLFSSSTEVPEEIQAKEISGLDIIPAKVTKFNSTKLKIPHMGWTSVYNEDSSNPLFKGIPNESQFYFVHSYRVNYTKLSNYSLSTSAYGEKFISAIWNQKNLFACQFHPEKSAESGLELLKNFANL